MAEKKKDQPSLKDLLKPLFQTVFRPPLQIPQTINESRRALALLRSLPNKTKVTIRPSGSGLINSFSPATNRSVTASVTRPTAGRTNPTTTVGFTGPQGFENQKFRGALKSAKYQGLLYQLGDVLKNTPPGTFYGVGSDDQRKIVYQRYGLGPQGVAYKRPDGTFQPRNPTGTLGKATDASGRLTSGLARLAENNVVRTLTPKVLQMLNVHPALKTYVNVENTVKDLTGVSLTKEYTKNATRELLKILNRAPTMNYNSLPF